MHIRLQNTLRHKLRDYGSNTLWALWPARRRKPKRRKTRPTQ
jgi:hypothetical protein